MGHAPIEQGSAAGSYDSNRSIKIFTGGGAVDSVTIAAYCRDLRVYDETRVRGEFDVSRQWRTIPSVRDSRIFERGDENNLG